jgi:hypothetical protein
MMHHRKKIKAIILINLFFLISIYIVSIFFRPNLNIRKNLFFRDIIVNEKISIINKIDRKGTIDVDNASNLESILKKFLNNLLLPNTKLNIKNCGSETILGNFRNINIFDIHDNLFSVSIKSDDLSEEEIQKCFEELFIEKLNDFYLILLDREIKKLILKKNFEEKNELEMIKTSPFYFGTNIVYGTDFIKESFKTERQINYLKTINFLINPDFKYKSTDNKNVRLNFVIYYFCIVIIFFILEIIILYIYYKKNLQKIILDFENLFFH